MSEDIICSKCGSPNKPDTVFCGKCGTRIVNENASKKTDPMIGSFVGDRFLVHEKLGEGGMGVVYRAEQTAIQREVALKVLHSNLTQDESLYARFQNEAAASSRLNHPNTITIYDFGRTGQDSLYIAMEFIQGKSLDDEIHENGPMDAQRACHIAIQICGSLQDAHDHSIVHRDLKPENVMLCERGGDKDVVKVLDFGIAKIMEDDGTDQRKALTKTGMVFGTPQYMSPEQIRGEKVDNKTDIYSLGVILYQMLAGKLPFSADTPMGLLTKHLMDTPAPLDNPGIPKDVETVLMTALEKEPEKRPESMKAFGEQLGSAIGMSTGQMPQMTAPGNTAPLPQTVPESMVAKKAKAPHAPPSGSPKKGLPIGLIAGIIVLLLGGGASAWYFLAGPGAAPAPTPMTAAPQLATIPPSAPGTLAQPGAQVPTTVAPPTQPGAQPAAGAQPAPLPFAQPTPGATADPAPETPEKSKGGTNAGREKKDTTKPKTDPDKTDPNKPDADKPDVTDPKPDDSPKDDNTPPSDPKTEAKCSYSGGKTDMDKAVRSSIKKREAALKKCTVTASDISTTYSFKISKKGKKLEGLSVKLGSANSCVEKVLASARFKPNTGDVVSGMVIISLSKANDVIDKCKVSTRMIGNLSKINLRDKLRLKRDSK